MYTYGSRGKCTFGVQLHNQLIILYNIIKTMRAQVKTLSTDIPHQTIQLICNPIQPLIVPLRRPTKHYKKVGKEARAKLLRCIQSGWSIINVAKKFNINYSTAKSIVQNHKKRVDGAKIDDRPSETEECESQDIQL